jgi:hypothetical protein
VEFKLTNDNLKKVDVFSTNPNYSEIVIENNANKVKISKAKLDVSKRGYNL